MQDQELRYRIQLDRRGNQHGELREGLFEQRSTVLTVEENAKNVRRSTGPRIGDSGAYAEENGHCRLQNESKTAGPVRRLQLVVRYPAALVHYTVHKGWKQAI